MKKENIIKNMEFLIEELHTEWERSGAVKTFITITQEDADDVTLKIKTVIYKMEKSVEDKDLNFKQSMKKSKECYILLRLIKKIIRQDDLARDGEIDGDLVIGLDKEELRFYKKIINDKVK